MTFLMGVVLGLVIGAVGVFTLMAQVYEDAARVAASQCQQKINQIRAEAEARLKHYMETGR